MKRLLSTDEPYNLSPMQYPWAYVDYKKARKNFWEPELIAMGGDKHSFDKELTADEKGMFLDVFAMLTTSDLVIQENIALRIYERFAPPEVRLFLGHQLADESLHSQSYQHCIEVLALNEDDIYKRYLTKPAIGQKFEIAKKYADFLQSSDEFEVLLGLIFFYLGWEGIWFYHGFSPIFSLKRRQKMRGTSEQLEYIARDEVTHFEFGLKLCLALMKEIGAHKHFNWSSRIQEVLTDIIVGEDIYAKACLPAIVGYNYDMHMAYTRYLANVRLAQLGIPQLWFDKSMCYNSIPWLDELLRLKKEKNFFETHVGEYQSGIGLDFGNGKFDLHDILQGLG